VSSLPSGPFAYLKQLSDVAWVVAAGKKLARFIATHTPSEFKT